MKNAKSKTDKSLFIAYLILIISVLAAGVLITYSLVVFLPKLRNPVLRESVVYTAEEYEELSEKIEKEAKNVIKVSDEWIDTSSIINKSVRLPISFVSQYPELPTGCEITSLAMLLNFYDYDVLKTDLCEKYLKKAPAPADFEEVFVGEPTDNHGFGCYLKALAGAANRFLYQNGGKYKSHAYKGFGFLNVLSNVDKGIPVIIWGTQNLAPGIKTVTWTVDGKELTWIAPEHCMVLIGYDLDKMTAIVADPQKGIVNYDIKKLKQSYETLGSQYLILEESEQNVESE